MSGNHTGKYYSEEEIADKVKILNTCYNLPFQWESRRAQKEHKDMFDVGINDGDYYFRLRIDNSFSNDLKLSYKSMERFLYAIFIPYPNWEKQANEILGERMDKLKNIIEKLRP